MIVDSGYRCPAHNWAVGSVPNSYHVRGMAADIRVPGLTL
ncbi:D-Ala-D-Ala carboxypeptidase family metallohydrolase [Desulfotomaculum nigrificans]|nr:D-Ala-D-Ala carboxypeptidase family metallohydrolase [Desulfotomaculum nigrificans]